jgi:hypothetical protein
MIDDRRSHLRRYFHVVPELEVLSVSHGCLVRQRLVLEYDVSSYLV